MTPKMTEVKRSELIIIFFMLLQGFVAALNCSNPTPKSLINALEKTLFAEKLVHPVTSFSDPLNITINVHMTGIIEVNEKAQTLTTIVWRILEWHIPGLSWDERECGTTKVSVPRENIWTADIHISEFMHKEKSPIAPYVYINNTGHVLDINQIRVVSTCRLVIYTFPFDVQNCSLTFEPYIHTTDDITLTAATNSEELLAESRKIIETNGEWELTDIKVVPYLLTLEDGVYSQVKYYVVLRRRPILYVVNLLIPSCFLVTVDLFSFLLPPQSVDRSAFKMTLILGYTVFLLIMNDLLPATGETTPLINVFFSVSLVLMVGSLLETVFITNIHHSAGRYGGVPRWLSVLILRYVAVLVCLPPKRKNGAVTVFLNPTHRAPAINSSVISSRDLRRMPGDTLEKPPLDPILEELRKLNRDLMAIRLQMDKQCKGSITVQEWQMIGMVIDRLLFGLYIVFISVSFITIISIWVWSNSYAV